MGESPSYEVRLTRAASKDLKRLPAQAQTIARALRRLQYEPTAGHALQGSLTGVRSLDFSFQGGGAGRAAYVLLPERRVCLVFINGAHEGFYERAERRASALHLPDDD